MFNKRDIKVIVAECCQCGEPILLGETFCKTNKGSVHYDDVQGGCYDELCENLLETEIVSGFEGLI